MSETMYGGNQAVSLGGIVLQDFEVPEVIHWGGEQHLAVHKIIGGTRVIDALGRDDAPITWSGVMLGPDASDRADLFDSMRVSGDVLQLIFAGRSYLVVVSSFQADQRKMAHVPYRISCTVLEDQSSGGGGYAQTSAGQINADVLVVIAIPPPPPLVPVAVMLAPVQVALVGVTQIDAGTAASDEIMANMLLAQQQVNLVGAAAGASLAGLAATAVDGAVLGSSGNAAGMIAAMNVAESAALEAATAAQMTAYLGRASVNLGNI